MQCEWRELLVPFNGVAVLAVPDAAVHTNLYAA